MQHSDPDYSAAYVVVDTDCGLKGFGITFTLGKGTEIGENYADDAFPKQHELVVTEVTAACVQERPPKSEI